MQQQISAHHLFQWRVLELGTFDQVIEVGDISLVMLAVMEFQRFFGNVRREGVLWIG